MSYALPVDLVYKVNQLGDIDKLTDEVNKELSNLMLDYLKAIDINGRTTVGAASPFPDAGQKKQDVAIHPSLQDDGEPDEIPF